MEVPINATHSTHAITLRLDGADMLVKALNDHSATIELARHLAAERDALQAELTAMRAKYESKQ